MVGTAFLIVVFLMGGGARQDIQSIALLRPIAAGFLAYAIVKGPPPGMANGRFVRLMTMAIVALAVVHLVPLPPGLWSSLPGRGIVERIDQAAGIAGTWRPLAMVPPSAWNALFSLIVPAAALALAVRLPKSEHARMAIIFLLIGLASIFVGIVQMLGGDGSPLYLYRIQNVGHLAGLFSNRNHQAIFLATLFPLIAFIASRPIETVAKQRLRLAGLTLIGLFIASALVVASSRAGFVLGVVGAIVSIALFRYPRVSRRTQHHSAVLSAPSLMRWRLVAISMVLALVGLFYSLSSSAIGERVAGSGGESEDRVQFWPPIVSAIWQYFPFGSGNGSFVEVYKVTEPTGLIDSSYLNHAHNDYLETALTLGLPGIVLIVLLVWAWLRATIVIVHTRDAGETVLLARAGSAIVAMLALASMVDYPLRTPSIACLFVFALIWLAQGYACVTASNEGRTG